MSREQSGTAAAPLNRLEAALQHIQAGRPAAAEPILNAVLATEGRHPDALHLLGLIRHQEGQHQRALDLVREALAMAEPSPLYWNTLGSIQRAMGRTAEAVASFGRAVALAPGFVQAQVNLGLALHALGRVAEAEAAYRRAAELAPDQARVHAHLGAALFDLARYEEAAAAFARALALGPAEPGLRVLLARALMRSRRYDEAAAPLREALAVNPGDAVAEELLHECRAVLCDWSAFDEAAAFYRKKSAAGRLDLAGENVLPGALLGLTRAEQLAFARKAAGRALRFGPAPARNFARAAKSRLRIGYLAGVLGEHPVARLAAELFERHDRARVEIFAYSGGPDDASPLRRRLLQAFDRFTDLRPLSLGAAAERIAADGIDVLVDLAGYTSLGLPQILALRPAPIQASFLGYPATMGAPFVDYIIADRFVLPPEHAADYAEAPAYLPDCYLPQDRQRESAPVPSRAECGLPDAAFVFAYFGPGEKITPAMFDVWASLVRDVAGSVLWLRDGDPGATRNLRAAAEQRGCAGRLVFAAPVEHAAPLAHIGAADLCLDTFPYNDEAGASEALAAGVPIVTCVGDSFAARVCGSALSAAGLPELITGSLGEYRALALRLAGDRAILGQLRAKLRGARATAALFDTPRFARSLEALYARMWERHVAGEKPAMIALR